MRGQGRRSAQDLLGVVLAAFVAAALTACGGRQAPERSVAQDCRGGKVWHQEDAERLRGCRVVEGGLQLGGALESAEALQELREVRGTLEIGPSYQLSNLAGLAQLHTVSGGVLVAENNPLSGLFLPALVQIGGSLRIHRNRPLRTVSAHRLRHIGEGLEVRENASLERLDLSEVQECGKGPWIVSGARLVDILGAKAIGCQKLRPDAAVPPPVY